MAYLLFYAADDKGCQPFFFFEDLLKEILFFLGNLRPLRRDEGQGAGRAAADTGAAAEAVVEKNLHAFLFPTIFNVKQFERGNVTGLLAEPAADTGLAVDLQGIVSLGYAHGKALVHPAEQLAAAGAAITDKRWLVADIVGDMGQLQIPGLGKDGQQLFLAALFGKAPAHHEFGGGAEGNTDLPGRCIFIAALVEMLFLVPAVTHADSAIACPLDDLSGTFIGRHLGVDRNMFLIGQGAGERRLAAEKLPAHLLVGVAVEIFVHELGQLDHR